MVWLVVGMPSNKNCASVIYRDCDAGKFDKVSLGWIVKDKVLNSAGFSTLGNMVILLIGMVTLILLKSCDGIVTTLPEALPPCNI